jgi:cytochrome c biogenesis protein CcmG/thiol:disulfide interchange protein DsbE
VGYNAQLDGMRRDDTQPDAFRLDVAGSEMMDASGAPQTEQSHGPKNLAGGPEYTSGRRLSPTWLAVGVIALVVAALLSYGLIAKPVEPPQVGSPVPDFQLTALDRAQAQPASVMNLSEQRGKVAVVNFFASWCAPCRQEAADLEQTWREYREQGVQFFGIAYKDADSRAQSFLDEFDVTYPAAVERTNSTARAYGVTGVPETFIIDQQGLLVRHILGPISQAELSLELDRLLSR